MLDKNERPYLDSLVRPAQLELTDGTCEYLYNKHKYKQLADALNKRRNVLGLREKQFSSGITEDLVRRAEAEFSTQKNRNFVFSGPFLPTDSMAPEEKSFNEESSELRASQHREPLVSNGSVIRKVCSLIIVAAGAFAMLYGANMDTSFAAGQFGRVHNLDLASQQRNILIVGGVGVIAGLVLLAIGYQGGSDRRTGDSQSPPREATKKCPACAELIKKEAKLCRFCGTKQVDGQE